MRRVSKFETSDMALHLSSN